MNMSFVPQVDQSNLQMASVVCFLYLYSTMMMEEPGIVPMEIWVESDIPLGAGLGSSAALSVCLAAGLMAVRHQVQVPFHFFPDAFFGLGIHKEKTRSSKLSLFVFAK
jgi:homoserine kinase